MNKTKFLFLALIMSSLFVFTSCEDDTPEVENIIQIAQSNTDLSILVDAITQAGLTQTLEGSGPFTVFAPTNQAFQDLLDSNPAWNSLSDIDNATLTAVLLYHVLGAEVASSDLTDSYATTSSTGPNGEQISIQIDVTGGIKFNGTANPVTVDISASNGIVHIIDEVMIPPTIVNHAVNNTDFTNLVAALTRSDLNTDYVTFLSGTGPFTVFAPNNQAFQDLLDSDPSWNTIDDIPASTLESVLNYHVIDGNNVQSDELVNNSTITTLGGTLTVDLSGGAKLETTSNQTVNIVFTDVQGSNGVVHVVDAVLLP